MADISYTRVSTEDQSIARQFADCPIEFLATFTDKRSGKNADRPGLVDMMRSVRKGDTVHVHSIDRLARNLKDLCEIVSELNERGVAVRFHKENLHFRADHSDPFAKMMLHVIGACAEFEREMIRSRVVEGVNKAKAEGKYKGRPVDQDLHKKIRAILKGGETIRGTARIAECSTNTVIKVRNEMVEEGLLPARSS